VTDDSPPEAYLAAAQNAKDLNETAYYTALGAHFGTLKPASLLYNSLLSLPFASYITSNFDPLLAHSAGYNHNKCQLPPMAYPHLDRAHVYNRAIYYIHGHIAERHVPLPNTIVLAQSEFDLAYAENSNILNFLIPTLENDPICFIGCGLKEPSIQRVFDICKKNQVRRQELALANGASSVELPKRYIFSAKSEVLTPSGEIDHLESERVMRKEDGYYAQFDMQVIRYNAASDDHSTLRRAFDRLANQPKVEPDFGWGGGPNGK